MELVCERLTGERANPDAFVSKDMQRGTELEPIAFSRYEALTGNLVRRTGFVRHGELLAGCSLDGDVDDMAGIIELKCPKTTTHGGYLRAGCVPKSYVPQITHNLWITGAAWCDFVSFDDRLPAGAQFFSVRVKRDQTAIDAYELMARQFLREVETECAAVAALSQAVA